MTLRTVARKILVRRTMKLFSALVLASIVARYWMHSRVTDRVYTDVSKVPACPVALVLGAKVYPDGRLSPLLRDRVDKAIELYKAGKARKLLMSGDNRFVCYNEPKRMRDYAVAHGVPAEDVAMDFAGRRTYDSVFRAKFIFGQNRLIVVSQAFHLDRALFYCDRIGVKEAYGVSADAHPTSVKTLVREVPGSLGALLDVRVLSPRPIMGKREKI